MEISHHGCILDYTKSSKEKWTFSLRQLMEQELTVTPFSSFCQKKGYDNSKQAFPLYKRIHATAISVPRQFMIDHFPIEKSRPFDLSSDRCGWATPKDQIQPLAVPLRPLQHEIVYEKLLPHFSNCYYQISPAKSFFFGGGLIILPCGYGKTKTIEEFFYAIGQHLPNGYRMLCICPTKAIAKQTAIAFRRDLKGCKVALLRAQDSRKSAGAAATASSSAKRILVRAGDSGDDSSARPDSGETVPSEKVLSMVRSVDVVVTLMSTLKSRNYGPLFYSHFGIVVIDEVHHMTAKGNSQLFFAMNPPILLGLTAEFDNKARTFSLLEKCIGPRLFEKRNRDGQDDIVVRKCQVSEDVLRYFFQDRKNANELISRMQSLVLNESGEMDYTKTIGTLMECKELQQFWCDHLLFMIDSIPEDRVFISTMKELRPVFSPVESPDLCDECCQECVFAFEEPMEKGASMHFLYCHACVSNLYFQKGDRLSRFRRKTAQEVQEEKDAAAARRKKNPKKRKAQTKPKARKRPRTGGDDEDGGEEADHPCDDGDDDEEAEEDALLLDGDVERLLQESIEVSRSIYEGTYFGRNQILVLCERVNPLCVLAELLKSNRPDLADEIGNIAGKNGNELEMQRSRGKQIILATSPKAKEGMDIPTINTTMNITPTTTIRQSMGRALRTQCRKYVYDFIYPNRLFWVQFQKYRKPEYDDHKCKFENFKLPKFLEWKKKQQQALQEEEEEGEDEQEDPFHSLA